MINAIFIVWRESLEAMLVIGVLSAWIARQSDRSGLQRTLWLGVIGGVLLAGTMAMLTFSAQNLLEGNALEIFQLCMVLIAAVLILEMLVWMRKHGRHMKQNLEAGAARAAEGSGQYGLALIAALAVGREGAETVVFLYGMGMERQGGALLELTWSALTGIGAAALTAWLVARGARYLNYRTLFRCSEVALLLIACSLIGNGVDRILGLDWLPMLSNSIWDSSALLDDSSRFGKVLADFVGYRAQPSVLLLMVYLAFWSASWWRLRDHSNGSGR